MENNKRIAIIGLGYVGLPLAVEFSKRGLDIVGFDINDNRINELKSGQDHTLEVSQDELKEAKTLVFTSSLSEIASAQIFIVTVPTPITDAKAPDLTPLVKASESIGSILKKGDIVIYESTVFPGCTEEVCVPVLEKSSGLKFNEDFFCGYSPERINPGDKLHRVNNIVKVTSGSTEEVAEEVDNLYKTIIDVGTHKASSIKVAEAAKVIENAQRDLNIAFVNELALIFDRIGIDTNEVIEAAKTKWNFLPFKPGLVGGHCIGVDPYYLTHKAESLGYHPQVILSGRRINNNMGVFVANKVIKLLVHNDLAVKNAKVLVLGITFKENCPDIRNTRVVDVVWELESMGLNVDIFDPYANSEEVKEEYGLDLVSSINLRDYKAIVLAVSHEHFKELNWTDVNENTVIYDLKGFLPKDKVTSRL